jgi:hypothetical protein
MILIIQNQMLNLTSKAFNAPNESVNLNINCIFIAVPKTGTTSIRSQVKSKGPYMINEAHLTISQVESLLYPYLLACNLSKNRSFPTKPEILSDSELRQSSNDIFQNAFKFGSVRNPWARVYSLYRRTEGIQMSATCSLSEFVKSIQYASDTCVRPLKTRSQLDWFKDTQGKIIMDYIIKLEEIDSAIQTIQDMTNNRIRVSNVMRNVNPNKQSYKDAFNQEDKNVVGAIFAEEIEYFGYTF